MNNKTLHIIGNEFTRKIAHSDEWWDHRLSIYEHFCLASIKNQTNKNFVLLMRVCDYVPEKYQQLLKQMLDDSRLQYVMFNSDKITLTEALYEYADKYQYVYYTRIDSDDLFHKDAISEIQTYDFAERRALLFQKGYCYDCKNDRLQHYYMPSPPFSTMMFPADIYMDESKHANYTKVTSSHDTVINIMNCIELSENKYIVNVHGTNRVTIYHDDRTVFKGHEMETNISAEDATTILKDFGISHDTYKSKVLL